MFFKLTLVSANAKTGPIPVSMSSSETCPDACPLKSVGCYAKTGNFAIHWNRLSSKGWTFAEFLKAVKALPFGQLWRHNQAGDLPGKNNEIDARALARLVKANEGKRGFTYSHKPMTQPNKRAIARANAKGFTVNLSADSLDEADELKALGIGPVVTLLPSDQLTNVITPKGNRVVVCPAVTRKGVTCSTCKLCQRADRTAIVGFPAHGMLKRKVDELLKKA